MKIAIIGSGISGNVIAYKLHQQHDITLFEMNNHIGGHTHTHDVLHGEQNLAVDTGFIVFNYKTYPYFTRLLEELGVEIQPSTMSFSVKCDKSGLEYNGTSLNSMFAQRTNLLRPSFYRMIKDILRFNKEAVEFLQTEEQDLSLSQFLILNGYGVEFIENYLIPMGAAIWSASPDQMYKFPAGFFIRFFHNHGMLSVNERPVWHVIKGGSREYVKKLTATFNDKIHVNTGVKEITRHPDKVTVRTMDDQVQDFDHLFIATHSDQALNLLSDPSCEEKAILGSIPYQNNEVVLHTDDTILPKRKLAWAAWNYHISKNTNHRVALTYNMNILQNLQSDTQFCVTLNHSEHINPDKIIKRLNYDHPVFTPEGVIAQQRQYEINGVNRTYYCGAYWRFGFHEDGVISALNALQHFEEKNNGKLFLQRAS